MQLQMFCFVTQLRDLHTGQQTIVMIYSMERKNKNSKKEKTGKENCMDSGGSRIFPGGGANPQGGGCFDTILIKIFPKKLHEIEKNLIARRDPPLMDIPQKGQSVADPGFPRGGGTNPQGGAPGYDFIKISQKLHEIKENLARGGGGARPLRPTPLDPPLSISH